MVEITPLDSWTKQKTGARGRDELLQYQLEKIRHTLKFAKEGSRFYREFLKHINPDSIRSRDDLSGIPFTTPDMIAEDPLRFVCVPPETISKIITLPTSGSTGPRKRLFFTDKDLELTVDFFKTGMSTMARPGYRVIIFLPGKTIDSVGQLLLRGLRNLGCDGVVYGAIDDYDDAARALSQSGCDCAVGLPSQLYALSLMTSSYTKLKSVLLCSDYVPDSVCAKIRETWKCEVFGHYGSTETGLGGGVECGVHNGYHMWESDLYFEIIGPETGKPLPEGHRGEIVFTTLNRRGMPLIRYRTGDISSVLPAPCPCGSMLRRFERVSGRLRDTVTLGGGRAVSMPMLDEIVYSMPGILGYSAEIHQTPPGRGTLILTVCEESRQGTPKEADFIAEVSFKDLEEKIRCGIMRPPSGGDMVSAMELEVRAGTAEVLTYGSAKRRIEDKRKADNNE